MLLPDQQRALTAWKARGVAEERPPILEELGLAQPGYRLVSHLGLWLFCETVSPSAKFYYGNDSLELSRVIEGAEGEVLDLCSGPGTQALVCARTAARVTAVEIEPQAAKLFWINAAINGLTEHVELLNGDLLEPVAGRKFDLIACNPPFMPVPPGLRYPRYADGGGDGLQIVRRLMAGLPEALAPGGRCEVIGAVLGTGDGPDLTAFKEMASDAILALTIDCRTCEELEGKAMRQAVATAIEGSEEEVGQAFRSHFARLGATHLYCYLLHAERSARPLVCSTYHDGQSTVFWNG